MKSLPKNSSKVLALFVSAAANLAIIVAIDAGFNATPPVGPRMVQLPSVTIVGKSLPEQLETSTVAGAPVALTTSIHL